MNISLNTTNYNTQYYNNKSSNFGNKTQNNLLYNNNPSFTSLNNVPQKSQFLNPISKAFDKFTDWISKNYTDKLYTSWLAKKLAQKTDKLDSVVDLMSIAGSVVISGMYMFQTLRNPNLDEDRRKTLAINQGLTFAVSTLGSVLIDNSLDKWWEGKTQKYVEKVCENYKIEAIILFGSYAKDNYTADSDYDIYVICPDGAGDAIILSQQGYRALRGIRKKPVDLLVGFESKFNERAEMPTLEQEVKMTGVVLYEQ